MTKYDYMFTQMYGTIAKPEERKEFAKRVLFSPVFNLVIDTYNKRNGGNR